MASVKAEKPVGTQLFGQAVKKEPAAKPGTDGATKAPASKSAKKAAPKAPQESKKKGKGGKSTKH
ncbi:hypothetical protein I3760_05G117900 [Carya illinoinensis]|uniref:Uncharacterized protein n=1 Tax=Carya illinoinensis TaxID=32201 RepID=A0A8T1QI45_CARIL|nr:hypothetical protein I3760_05G117900 [Carya illinoinensis]KAG6654013.1 hypothetical protein CIPAW_05G116600 [Carya illinoinensis]KAG6712666.1 hypothetical protein I3842_05G113500 [Carya illinoinensis]